MSGLAGGLAGGLLGGLLFGGMGHASQGSMSAGGVGLMDLALIALLLYLGYRFFKGRRARHAAAYNDHTRADNPGTYAEPQGLHRESVRTASFSETEAGFGSAADPAFTDELKETFQDIFFRVQAAWMNRSAEGIEGILGPEIAAFFAGEFESMKNAGIINRLENIAIRKVEQAEVWQETGADYITVLFTANLLDYTVDERTGDIVKGDKVAPVKFQEFWTFSREIGSTQWRLSAINQLDEAISASH